MRDLFQGALDMSAQLTDGVKRDWDQAFMGQAGKGTFSPYSIGTKFRKSHYLQGEAGILHQLCAQEREMNLHRNQ